MLSDLSLTFLAYLTGSLPVSYLVATVYGRCDLRGAGSGSVGALNVYRATGRIGLGAGALLGDLLKGLIVLRMALTWSGQPSLLWPGVAVVLGHNYALFLGFRGGKGLATSAGFLLPLAPVLAPIWLGWWGLIYLPSRLIVLGTIVATLLAPWSVLVLGWSEIFPVVLAISLVVLSRHLGRIRTLLAGREPKDFWGPQSSEPA